MAVFSETMNGLKKDIKRVFTREDSTVENIIPEEIHFFTKDIFKSSDYSIGEYTYGAPNILDWSEGATLKIGKFCSIANDVEIFTGGNHRVDWISTYPFSALVSDFPNAAGIEGHPISKGDVEIGNDVWIGRGVTIMSGVKIGDGAVLGARSLIAKNVNPYEIVVGNPGRVLKKRFDDDVIKMLLKIAWWDWPYCKINEEVKSLCDTNIGEFLLKHYTRD